MSSETNFASFYSGPKYLSQISELEEKAIACLGTIEEASFDEYAEKMTKIAKAAEILNPLMAIDIKYKSGAFPSVSEWPYPIIKVEWDRVKEDAKEMFEYTPRVFVIDGSNFTLHKFPVKN